MLVDPEFDQVVEPLLTERRDPLLGLDERLVVTFVTPEQLRAASPQLWDAQRDGAAAGVPVQIR